MVNKIKQSISMGQNIRKMRLRAGFGVTELARFMQLLGCENTTRESINKIEAGYQNITLMQLWSFIRAFDISYNDFFQFLEEENNDQ